MKSRAAVTLMVLVAVSFASRSDIVVEIKQGSLRGTTLTSPRSNRIFFAFMGIPYAKPPIGDLRFKISLPAGKWDGVRDALEEGPKCPQMTTNQMEGEEDCLFLNVFTPKVPSGPEDSLKPVMVSIHGGGFFYGSGNRDFAGPDYLVDGGVIFVSMNYRLGTLGFLSLQNEEVPGNAGLKDQVLALKWVKENIKAFGGDPGAVTIIGESAGAACVHYHLLSPMSKGLFHRAISQSGSAVNPWGFHTPSSNLEASFLMGRKLGVNTSDPHLLLQQLRNVTPAQITEAFNTMIPWTDIHANIPFRPTTDKRAASGEVFLPDTPINIMNSGRFQKLPYITGITSHEGILQARDIKGLLNHTTDENTQPDLSKGLDFGENNIRSQEIDNKIKDFYFGGVHERNATLLQYVNFISDVDFVNGIYCTVQTQAAYSTHPVYSYEFSFNTKKSVFKNLFGGADLPGASHADDLPFLFTTSFLAREFEPASPEFLTSNRMLKMWTNFAKTGNPTPGPDPLLQGVIWSPVTTSEFSYLTIDTDLKLQHDFRKESIAFWGELYRNYTPHSACLKHWWNGVVRSSASSTASHRAW